jgi:RNA polymerase sigma factor (sigma-70 family)
VTVDLAERMSDDEDDEVREGGPGAGDGPEAGTGAAAVPIGRPSTALGGDGRTVRVLAAPATFEEVYARSYRRLTRIAHLMTGGNGVAEEVVQDAFVALYRRFDQVADPDGYLYRSVVNGAKARYRRRQVAERLSRVRQVSPDVAPPDIDETWQALERLSARRRAAVALRYYADLSVDEIADLLDCRPATVRSLLHRGLADLKELITR